MNLYQFHIEPETLHRHQDSDESVVEVFWDKYFGNPEELKKRENTIAKNETYSYLYARYVLKGRFPLGEAIIKNNDFRWKIYCHFIDS